MKEYLNILYTHQKKIQIGILSLFVAVTFYSLSIQFFNAVGADRYFIAHEDETIYYGSAQVFSSTGSLQAESCIDENVSRVGHFNWYGPGYNVIYGTLQLVFGHSNTLFIKFHFLLALLMLVLVLCMPMEVENKLLIASILLITEQFTCYIFSYFPEMLHLFFSTILVFLLIHIYKKEKTEGVGFLVTVYVALVLIITLCRVTTIFWMAAILPLGSNWRQRTPYILIFFLSVAASVIYLRFCTAPPYASGMHKLQELYSFNLWEFVHQTIRSLVWNFGGMVKSNSTSVYLTLALIIALVFNFWKTRDKFFLAALFVSACLLGALMAYYTVDVFYFVKQTAMLLPLLLLAFMRSSSWVLKWSLFFVLLYLWVPVSKKRASVIEDHQAAYVRLTNNNALRSAFQQLKNVVTPNKDIIILWCYNEFDYGGTAQALLPYSTTTNNPILYTTNVIFDHSKPLEEKFKLHHKLPVDYLLSRNPVNWNNLQLVMETPYFYFYKIKQNPIYSGE